MGKLGSLDDKISRNDARRGSLPEVPEGWTRRCSAAYLLYACARHQPPVRDTEKTSRGVAYLLQLWDRLRPSVNDVEATVREVQQLDGGVPPELARECVSRAKSYFDEIFGEYLQPDRALGSTSVRALQSSSGLHATIAQRVDAAFTFNELLPALDRMAENVGNLPGINWTVAQTCRRLWETAAISTGTQIR